MLTADDHGAEGPRCLRHGAGVTRCNVNGCRTLRKADLLSDDEHGVAGPRCVRHGAERTITLCNVYACGKQKYRHVGFDDDYGAGGPRCMRHGAIGAKCKVGRGAGATV